MTHYHTGKNEFWDVSLTEKLFFETIYSIMNSTELHDHSLKFILLIIAYYSVSIAECSILVYLVNSIHQFSSIFTFTAFNPVKKIVTVFCLHKKEEDMMMIKKYFRFFSQSATFLLFRDDFLFLAETL